MVTCDLYRTSASCAHSHLFETRATRPHSWGYQASLSSALSFRFIVLFVCFANHGRTRSPTSHLSKVARMHLCLTDKQSCTSSRSAVKPRSLVECDFASGVLSQEVRKLASSLVPLGSALALKTPGPCWSSAGHSASKHTAKFLTSRTHRLTCSVRTKSNIASTQMSRYYLT